MFKRYLSLGAVLAVCGATAGAAQAMTVTLGKPTLSGRVAITEPVIVSCSPFDPSLTLAFDSVSVSVEQASGGKIASASGFSRGALSFPCDGSVQTIPVTILASTSGPPFHGGPALFTASASASAGVPCFPGSTTCFSITAIQSATVGPTKL